MIHELGIKTLTQCNKDIGHLSFLERAATYGDFLIVGVHTDVVSGSFVDSFHF